MLRTNVDTCLIIPLRAGCNLFGALSSVIAKEKNHETSDQDFDPDGSLSGHFPRSHHSAGSRRGRRPALFVPTQTTELPNYPATDELAS